MPNRPNILFAIADDASHFSAYGHSFVDTSHFDRVARDGLLFNGAFTTNPKCAPSRASLLRAYALVRAGRSEEALAVGEASNLAGSATFASAWESIAGLIAAAN